MSASQSPAESPAKSPAAPDRAASAAPWPVALRYSRGRRVLSVTFDNETAFEIPAELLRVESPSAEVQGHGPGERQLVTGKTGVTITAIEPVGLYAVRLCFDDGHDTGFYTWETLHRLGRDRDALIAAYEARLAAAGFARDGSRNTP
ncbi:MAG: gamma-butyrobetaine hydroxylase-like domain-containing protein [Alphaproteobacteria bacterium]